MPEGAGRRPGRQKVDSTARSTRTALEPTMPSSWGGRGAWRAEEGKPLVCMVCTCGSPSAGDTHGRADGPISDSSGCDHVKAPACVLRSALIAIGDGGLTAARRLIDGQ